MGADLSRADREKDGQTDTTLLTDSFLNFLRTRLRARSDLSVTQTAQASHTVTYLTYATTMNYLKMSLAMFRSELLPLMLSLRSHADLQAIALIGIAGQGSLNTWYEPKNGQFL